MVLAGLVIGFPLWWWRLLLVTRVPWWCGGGVCSGVCTGGLRPLCVLCWMCWVGAVCSARCVFWLVCVPCVCWCVGVAVFVPAAFSSGCSDACWRVDSLFRCWCSAARFWLRLQVRSGRLVLLGCVCSWGWGFCPWLGSGLFGLLLVRVPCEQEVVSTSLGAGGRLLQQVRLLEF